MEYIRDVFTSKVNKGKNMSNFLKTEESSGNAFRTTYFEDPYESYRILKVNKQIHDNIFNIWAKEQVIKYKNIFDKEKLQMKQVEKMPTVRELKLDKNSEIEKNSNHNDIDLQSCIFSLI